MKLRAAACAALSGLLFLCCGACAPPQDSAAWAATRSARSFNDRAVERSRDPGVSNVDFVPATERVEPVASERPRRTLGLEAVHPAFGRMYRQISGSYRSLEPLVLDLPEYTPGLLRPDLMQTEPRREMIRTAIRQAFGRALMDALSAEAERITGKRWFPRLEPPVDTTPERALATSTLPPTAPSTATSPRYIFGISHMRTVLAGIDVAGFSLHADITARGAGGSRVWAVAPLRGPGMQGNVGVSSAGEVFVSMWLRF